MQKSLLHHLTISLKSLQYYLSLAPAVNETADVDFDLNFGMVRFPQFTKEFVEVYSRATVYYLHDRVEPPFQPEAMPEHANLTDKMIYIYVSDYILNSALYAGYLSGYMAYNVTPDIV